MLMKSLFSGKVKGYRVTAVIMLVAVKDKTNYWSFDLHK